MRRWFLRCPDCLSVAVVEAERAPDVVVCSCCDRKMEQLGHVVADRLLRQEERCACDERCTCAAGPSCSCKCGGANHGTGLVVTVQVDAGKAPQVCPPDARATQRRDEWRSALLLAEARAPGLSAYRAKLRGEYLSDGAYGLYIEHMEFRRRLAHVRSLRTHNGRMRAIRKLAGEETEEHHHDAAPAQAGFGW